MATNRSRRLRKKLCVDEFQELGFELTLNFKADLSDKTLDDFVAHTSSRLAGLSVDETDDAELTSLRAEFEGRWTRSNTARTFVACGVVVLLLLVVRSC